MPPYRAVDPNWQLIGHVRLYAPFRQMRQVRRGDLELRTGDSERGPGRSFHQRVAPGPPCEADPSCTSAPSRPHPSEAAETACQRFARNRLSDSSSLDRHARPAKRLASSCPTTILWVLRPAAESAWSQRRQTGCRDHCFQEVAADGRSLGV
jgi:hypothetical protein